jgi:hypothetical protein
MKAKARQILNEARREPGWVPEHAKGDQELWTAALVKKALLDAFRMLRRVEGRVGPAGMKAAWPEYGIDQADFVEQSIAKTLKEAKPKPEYHTRMTVTRMEQVLLGWKDERGNTHAAWLAGSLLMVPEIRSKLVAWIKSEIRGEPFTDLCKRRRWPLATAKRHRDRAAYMIADRLNRVGVEPWI